MPRFLPFRAMLGHAAPGENLADLITPQFDELVLRTRQERAAAHRLNFVRFESGRALPGERPGALDARQANVLKEVVQGGLIRPASDVSFWLMEITASDGSAMRGFVGMLELIDRNAPCIYEIPLPDEVEDRKTQLESLHLQTAPVTIGYRTGESGAHQVAELMDRIMREKPEVDFQGLYGYRHRLWPVDADETELEPLLSRREMVILDGTARYQAARDLARRMREADRSPSPFQSYNFILTWMVDFEREPVEFLSRHKAIRTGEIPHTDGAELLAKLEDHFEIERYKLTAPGAKEAELVNLIDEMDCIGRLNHCYGLYIGDKAYYLLYLRDADSYERLSGVEHSRRWKRLDISILHSLVFDGILGMDSTRPSDLEKLATRLSPARAVSLVDDGFASAVFLVNNPLPSHIMEIAEAGEPIPAHSVLLRRRPVVGPIMAAIAANEFVGDDTTPLHPVKAGGAKSAGNAKKTPTAAKSASKKAAPKKAAKKPAKKTSKSSKKAAVKSHPKAAAKSAKSKSKAAAKTRKAASKSRSPKSPRSRRPGK
jgi:uncharacterized protein (DUF1015 family)